MNFLIDENIGWTIVDYLRAEGHQVQWVQEIQPGISDKAILKLAYLQQWVIITYDQDFGELIFSQGEHHSGVILLRLSTDSVKYHQIALRKFLSSHHAEELVGRFWKVDDRFL